MSDVNSEKPFLYKSYSATRRVQNAQIKYFLPEIPNKLSIKIIDDQNRVVLEKDGVLNENSDEEGSSWFGPKNKNPLMKKGLNNYTWNLRYPGASEFEGMIIWSAKPSLGPIAPPGVYEIELTVDDQRFKTSIEVKKDPRIEISDEIIRKQFDFAMDIMRQTDLANKSVMKIRSIKNQLNKISSKSSLAKSKKIKSLIYRLEKIESSIYQTKNQSGQDPLNFPIKVNNRLAYLRKSVESGDGILTKGSIKVYNELKDELSNYLIRLKFFIMNQPSIYKYLH